MAFDVESLTVLGGPVSVAEGLIRARRGPSANYAVSDDGTLFYLTGNRGAGGPLVWVDRAGSVEVVEMAPVKAYSSPRLSPDGGRVLVVADGDAWTYDLASGRETRVTTDGATLNYAGWTPSGDQVTFTSSRGSSDADVWIQPADGSGTAVQLTALAGRVHFDSWAPDGRTFSAHHHAAGARTEPANQLVVPFDGAANRVTGPIKAITLTAARAVPSRVARTGATAGCPGAARPARTDPGGPDRCASDGRPARRPRAGR